MVVLRDQGKDKSGDVGRQIYDLVKSGEFRNAIGDADFDKAISGMVRADVATGGIVTPQSFLQMSQMLKSALPGLSDHFLYEVMPELAQEFRGPQSGTAMASLYQQLVAGQMRTKGVNLLSDLGMVNKDKVEFNSIGMIKAALPGFFTDEETFKSNPMQGIADIRAAMIAHGITDEGTQRDMFSQLFGNRNAATMAQTLAYQAARLGRGAQGFENTWDLGPASEEPLKNNAMDQFRKTWADLNIVLLDVGKGALPLVVDGLRLLDAALKELHAGLGWLDGLPGIVADNPIARFDQAAGQWIYSRASMWGGSSPTLSGSGGMGPGSGGRGGGVGNPGVGGWWTQDRMKHAADRLVKEAGLSPMGAAGLVARWAAVESPGGPGSVNPVSGAFGVGQWLGDRKAGIAGDTSFDDQLSYAISELNGKRGQGCAHTEIGVHDGRRCARRVHVRARRGLQCANGQ
jgi:hypothetical protein